MCRRIRRQSKHPHRQQYLVVSVGNDSDAFVRLPHSRIRVVPFDLPLADPSRLLTTTCEKWREAQSLGPVPDLSRRTGPRSLASRYSKWRSCFAESRMQQISSYQSRQARQLTQQFPSKSNSLNSFGAYLITALITKVRFGSKAASHQFSSPVAGFGQERSCQSGSSCT